MNSEEIRKKFLDFFSLKNHLIVSSSSLLAKDDMSLMFCNSGMNQFKNIFLGTEKPTYLRVANIQKCLRVSGKHNDFDVVGKDTYHHTMFEMLGNWSFGDYFKKEAINWAWELLTDIYKIPKKNIYVTIFSGDKKEMLEKDEESYLYWKELIDENHILEGNKKDNFWEMGVTGPCGPCSEIHIDFRNEQEKEKISGKLLVNNNHPEVIEIWNLVFMEFLRHKNKKLEKLPNKHIDTGIGFERLCMILQNKKSTYDTDLFIPLIKELEKITNYKYKSSSSIDIAMRIIVDHIRSVSFAIADGEIPNNSGSGYVIRKLLRRAITYGSIFLKQKKPFLYRLISILKNQMTKFYPEISKNYFFICQIVKQEEIAFLLTLKRGINQLEKIIKNQKKNKKINGAIIYELHDTYGFPADLSRMILEKKGFIIDESKYIKEKKRIQYISKSSSLIENFDWIILKKISNSNFIGYDFYESEIEITQYRKIKNNQGYFYQLVFDHTPFYPESGGQIGDIGIITNSQQRIEILDTQQENNLILHITKIFPISLLNFNAKINIERRQSIEKNHSATHLLHESLYSILGEHIEQKGSYISDKYLRFDFSHFSKISQQELKNISNKVNKKIITNIPLKEYRTISKEKAFKKNVKAFFGDKYGDYVRLIEFGSSKELCKGTHVKQTLDIRFFEILSESSIAFGIRRIEATSGMSAINYLREFKYQIEEISQEIKNKNFKLGIKKIINDNIALQKENKKYERIIIDNHIYIWKKKIINKERLNYLSLISILDQNLIKKIIFKLKNEIINLFIIICSSCKDKLIISIGISNSLIEEKQLNANKIAEFFCKKFQGKGGGNNTFSVVVLKNNHDVNKIFNEIKNKLIFNYIKN